MHASLTRKLTSCMLYKQGLSGRHIDEDTALFFFSKHMNASLTRKLTSCMLFKQGVSGCHVDEDTVLFFSQNTCIIN